MFKTKMWWCTIIIFKILKMYVKIILPKNINVKILKNLKQNKNLIIYCYTEYFNFYLINLIYNNFTHSLILNISILVKKKDINILQQFFNQLTTIFIKKIYFQGKGYKIRKINKYNFIEFFFGFCHFTIINFLNYKLKLRKKWSFLVCYATTSWLNYRLINLKNLKPWNVYTGRGLRIKKQITFKKPKRKAKFI